MNKLKALLVHAIAGTPCCPDGVANNACHSCLGDNLVAALNSVGIHEIPPNSDTDDDTEIRIFGGASWGWCRSCHRRPATSSDRNCSQCRHQNIATIERLHGDLHA